MASVRKYIEPPRWTGGDYKEHNTKFLKNVEEMFLAAGLVKSNIPDNLDTDNIDFTGIDLAATGSNFLKTMWFDKVDSNQENLPIVVGISLGRYKYNTNSNMPNFVYIRTTIKCGLSIHNFNNTSMNTNSEIPPWRNSKPWVVDGEYDSFVAINEGLLSISICGFFAESGSLYDEPLPFFLSSVTVERSFDDYGNYTSENVNIFSSSGGITSAPSKISVWVSDGVTSTFISGSLLYFDGSGANGIMKGGNMVTHIVYHIYNDYSYKPSPNIAVVNRTALITSMEATININDISSNFIAHYGGDLYVKPNGSLTRNESNVYSNNGKLIVRFE